MKHFSKIVLTADRHHSSLRCRKILSASTFSQTPYQQSGKVISSQTAHFLSDFHK